MNQYEQLVGFRRTFLVCISPFTKISLVSFRLANESDKINVKKKTVDLSIGWMSSVGVCTNVQCVDWRPSMGSAFVC